MAARPEERLFGHGGRKKKKNRNPHLCSGMQEGRLGRLKPKTTAASFPDVRVAAAVAEKPRAGRAAEALVPERGKKKVAS